ncbi:uncharacterized protein [Diadema antillarum]|uniref:uncharacterized protein n=1 Tax=Diadema antillarum TaxID=105358 RepID=UPI003A8C31CE
MSRRRASDITELRSGVLSLFSSKKRSLLQKESYELSPMYWKCCRNAKSNTVFLLGYRSEQSRNSGKHRLQIVVNGCTKELLPPILRAQNDEEVGNNYLCIQTDDDKLVFLKAEGNLQRDKWYTSLMEALGVQRPEKIHSASTSDLSTVGFTLAAQSMVVIEESEISGNERSEKPVPQRRNELVYHEPYQALENMGCSNSTDDDSNSWPCPRLTSSRVDLATAADVGTDDSSSSNREVDDDGYIFPIKASAPRKPTVEEAVSETGSSGSGSPPRKPTLLDSPLTTRAERDAFRSELRELTLTKKPAPEDSDLADKGSSSPPRKLNNKPLPGPPTKAKETKSSEPSKTGSMKSVKKPLKLPPPIPAGGNQKPRPANVNKQELPAPPQPSLRPRLGNPPAPPPPSPCKPTANIGNEIYSLVKSFRSNQMSPDTKAVEIARELLKENSLTFITIQNKVYIGELGVELAKCDLFIGDEVQRVNEQAVTTAEGAFLHLQSTDGDSVSLYIKKIPYGVMSYISRPLETSLTLDKLGLTLAGNEVTHISTEGLVARSGIPSRQQAPGVTNDGQLGNWALTQLNMTPVSAGLDTAEVERKLAEAGNMVALVFQPVDFANALSRRETTWI